MKKAIVITTINSPTQAIAAFAKKKDYQLIVVGDQKTPEDWAASDTYYLSVKTQRKKFDKLSMLIPYNHYARKNLGYLFAYHNGCEIIVDTDDDNVPYENWSYPRFNEEYFLGRSNKLFVNIYTVFTNQNIWPRGLPLNCINNKIKFKQDKKFTKVGVWQSLADIDPDVDAIHRLVINKKCKFNEHEPIVLDKHVICPFNSQNTAFRKELFPLLYLPSFVTFRYTDILRSIIAQPIMWAKGYHLGFTKATVYQERNEHDNFCDFLDEIPMYQTVERVYQICTKTVDQKMSIVENLFNCYEKLVVNNICVEEELNVLNEWILHFKI